MPTYEYECKECGHALEAFQRMSEEPLVECPECGQASLRRKIGLGAGIIFKGGGFYETDFKDRKGSKPESESKAGESAGAEASKKADKPEAKASAGSDAAKPSTDSGAKPAAAKA